VNTTRTDAYESSPDSELDERLRNWSAGFSAEEPDTESAYRTFIQSLSDAAEAPHEPTPVARIRSRRRRIGAAAVTALALTAAGYGVSARTGLFGKGGDSEDGSGEFIRLDSPEASEIVSEMSTEFVFPPQFSIEDWLRNKVNAPEVAASNVDISTRGVVATEEAVRAELAFAASCAWATVWMNESDPQSRSARQAADVVRTLPDWPIFEEVDGGGIVDSLRQRAEWVAAGDRAALRRDLQINCASD
jgi:hypothetical protein